MVSILKCVQSALVLCDELYVYMLAFADINYRVGCVDWGLANKNSQLKLNTAFKKMFHKHFSGIIITEFYGFW